MSTLAHHLGPTPQSEPLPGQSLNNAGGYSFTVDDWTRLDRFLILGSEGGTYYVSERELTIKNAACVERCLAIDGPRTVRRIAEISEGGRAPKNEPCLMALAIAAKRGDLPTRRAAWEAMPRVARIGTHLLHLAAYVETLEGWGRSTVRAFARWYLDMDPARLALQVMKYQSRDGWSHRDVLRKSHPKTRVLPSLRDSRLQTIFGWIVKGWESVGAEPHPDEVLAKIWAFERAKTCTRRELVDLISRYDLPHECVPNEAKDDPAVWEAMLPTMGMTAMIRNLGKMTNVRLLAPLSAHAAAVAARLSSIDEIKRARVHPIALLVALRQYAAGHGDKGKLEWSPVPQIVDALDAAFYAAFQTLEPTGRRHLLALDVSASMTWEKIAGMSITPREGSVAMALVTANVEPQHHIMAFASGIVPLSVSPRQRIDDACRAVNQLPASGTDCALPMIWALENKVPVDVFVVYTDSETWAGPVHPTVALKKYRQVTGIPAKLVVVGMTATELTIAAPTDAGMLDVAGFDSATPALLSDFAR